MTIPQNGYANLADAESDGLRHYWPFNQLTDADVFEDLVSGANLKVIPETQWSPDAVPSDFLRPAKIDNGVGLAPYLDAGDGHEVLLDPALSSEFDEVLYNEWTVSFWGLLTQNQWTYPLAFPAEVVSDGSASDLFIEYNGTDLNVSVAGSNFYEYIVPLPVNDFFLVTITQSTQDLRIYLGETLLSTYIGHYAKLRISKHPSSVWRDLHIEVDQSTRTITDELAVWDRAISGSEVSTIWNENNGIALISEDDPVSVVDIDIDFNDDIFQAVILSDWTKLIDPITTQIYYACDIDDGILPVLRVPISSWQATLQLNRSSYVQAVIPAATQYMDEIAARPNATFRISKGARFSDGSVSESILAAAPLSVPRLDEGGTNTTLTISGYSQLDPPTPGVRTLTNVRSQSSSPGIQVRADIDWFLRPGQTVIARDLRFVVSYINYYANTNDEFMYVGERVL